MKAIVVYESYWGNTASVAKAIAEGIGTGAQALTTTEATAAVVAGADLIVAGTPVIAFSLPNEKMRESIRLKPGKGPTPPDLSHPSLQSWMAGLDKGKGRSAAFETRVKMSPGGATPKIIKGLEEAGYTAIGEARRFIVKGKFGPLLDGELEKARQWGAELAKAMA
jgi:hypothetical protein